MKFDIYTDGAARGNPGPSASGFMILDEKGAVAAEEEFYIGAKTNNFAEYTAVIKALEWCAAHIPNKSAEIIVHSDSEIVVKQLNGAYKVRSDGLSALNARVKELSSALPKIKFLNVPRENAFVSRVDGNLNALLDKMGKNDK